MDLSSSDDVLFAIQGMAATNIKVQHESLATLAQVLRAHTPPPSSKTLTEMLVTTGVVSKVENNLCKMLTSSTSNVIIIDALTVMKGMDLPTGLEEQVKMFKAVTMAGSSTGKDVLDLVLILLVRLLEGKNGVHLRSMALESVHGLVVLIKTTCLPSSASMLQPTHFAGLIEALCFENKTNVTILCQHVGCALPAWLLRHALSSKSPPMTRTKCLRALINMTNECPDGVATLVQSPGGVGLLLVALEICLKNVLQSRNGVVKSPSQQQQQQQTYDTDTQFDICLLLLSLVANIVEEETIGLNAVANARVSNEVYFGVFLVDAFVQALPPRASADLSSGDTHSTIEFAWTPEELVLCSHVCLVLGCLVRDDGAKERLRKALPGRRGFSPLIQVLDGFLVFQQQAGVLTQDNAKSIQKVAGFLRDASNGLMLPPSFGGTSIKKQARMS